MKLSERFGGLILDRNTGRVVGSKLAAVTGHALMSVFFVYHNIKSEFNVDLWFVYASLVAGHKVAEKFIGLKWGNTNASTSTKDGQ